MTDESPAPRRRLGLPGQQRPGEQLETVFLDELPAAEALPGYPLTRVDDWEATPATPAPPTAPSQPPAEAQPGVGAEQPGDDALGAAVLAEPTAAEPAAPAPLVAAPARRVAEAEPRAAAELLGEDAVAPAPEPAAPAPPAAAPEPAVPASPVAAPARRVAEAEPRAAAEQAGENAVAPAPEPAAPAPPAAAPAQRVAEAEAVPALPHQAAPRAAEPEAEAEPEAADAPEVPLRAALEAVLMVVDEPITVGRLAEALERPKKEVAAALAELAAEYDAQGRGFELRFVAGGWRFYTRAVCAPVVDRFVLDGQQARLTQAALETLAVIAYRQPVSRSRVSAVRGVNCDGVMRTLVQRGLVEESGTEPETGAYLYRTTHYFLERMGLRGLDELPELAPFLPEADDVEADSQEGSAIAEAVAAGD